MQLVLLHQPHPPGIFVHRTQLLALRPLHDTVVLDQFRSKQVLQCTVGFDRRQTLRESLREFRCDAEGGAFGVVEGCCVIFRSTCQYILGNS